jgi:flagellar hook protein FlgE
MTEMITAERGYQANSRVITVADQMLQTAVGMGQ